MVCLSDVELTAFTRIVCNILDLEGALCKIKTNLDQPRSGLNRLRNTCECSDDEIYLIHTVPVSLILQEKKKLINEELYPES